ncbi:response regulator, partial [Enterococcus sp. S181_ASV_20]|nr:response regulator [Enterococcus sp. S181_ASV_20]
MKILIVDDEVKILDIIEAYLIANNYVVYKAQTGNEALEKIEKYNPQLIVLDIMLPDVDGINILKNCLLYTS